MSSSKQQEKFDADAIRQNTDLLEVASRYVDLKKEGAEYVGLCPFHADTTRPGNFKVNPQKQVWACFACGAHEEHGADVLGFMMKAENVDFPEACRKLTGNDTPSPKPIPQTELKKPPPRITFAPPDDAPEAPLVHKQFGPPDGTWTYRTETGALLGYVCRWNTPNKKEYRCITWGKQGNMPAAWDRKHFNDANGLRPIYGLDRLAADTSKQVLICEGEKAADAAQALLPGLTAIAWPGGSQAITRIDWEPIKGRRCVLWPDNDEPGIECMARLAQILRKAGASEVKGIKVSDMPIKWDAADWDYDNQPDPMAWAKPRVFNYFPDTPPEATKPKPKPAQPTAQQPAPPAEHPTEPPPEPHKTPLDAFPEPPAYPDIPESAENPTAPLPEVIGGPLQLATNDKGALLMNLDNALRAIQIDGELHGHLWYDEFLDAIITDWQGPQRQWTDADDVKLCVYLQRNMGLTRISVGQAHDAALMAALHDTRNEVHDYLNSLQWDGTERLPFMLADGFGADNNAYTQAVGRCWMVSMVARAMSPGCKVDTVPVLEGSQGKRKSSALQVIGGKWFVECHENVMSKDFYGVLNGHILVEISEMHTFSRAEIERVKGIISCQVDRYRKAYGRHTEDHPRKTVLTGTTNRDDYNKDETGGRRFLPVLCRDISLEYLQQNRDQLWAEAVHRYRLAPKHATPDERIAAGAAWWDIPEAEQKQEIDARRDVDSWEHSIEEWLNSTARDTVTVSDILKDCLEIETKDHDQMRQKRAGRVLRALGWINKPRRDENGRLRKVWMRNEA